MEAGPFNYKKVESLFYGHNGFIHSVAVDDTGKPFSGSNDHTIRSWDVEYKHCDIVFLGHCATVNCLLFYNNLLISGSRDNSIIIWDKKTGKCIKELKEHKGEISSLILVNDILYSSSYDGAIRTWDLKVFKNGCPI